MIIEEGEVSIVGTPCMIGLLNEDKSVSSIYCHWDGYISGVGKLLKTYYTDLSNVEKLIKLGDISSLGKYIEPRKDEEHSFLHPQEDVTVAYYRDRKDNWCECEPSSYHSANYYGRRCKMYYCYLYDTVDKCWKIWKNNCFVSY